MKRTDITDLFPDASKEAIDKLMSINGEDINAAKAETEKLREELTGKAAEDMQKAQKQIDELTRERDGLKGAETIRLMREKVAGDKKVPAHLLTGETEEACAKQADEILAFAQPGYPRVKDGGEVTKTSAASTRDKFANWAKDNL